MFQYSGAVRFLRNIEKNENNIMEFGRGLDPIIRWFYFCGLSSYPSFDGFTSEKTKKWRFVNYIPTGGLIGLVISIGSFVFLTMAKQRPQFSIFVFLYVFVPTSTMLVCAISAVFLSPYFAKICTKINHYEILSKRTFSLDPKAFLRHFMRRACIVLVTFMLPQLVAFYRALDPYILITTVTIMKGLVDLALIQALFYVDLLDYLLECFVRHVRMRAKHTELPTNDKKFNVRGQLVQELKVEICQYKLLQFELWKLSRNINRLFGWTFGAILLNNLFFTFLHMRNIYSQLRYSICVCMISKLKRLR